MKSNTEIPWEKIYNFILSCGNVHEPNQFSIEILSGLQELCKFDRALAYFMDGNGKVCNQYLVNMDEKWSNLYLSYYSKMEGSQYDCSRTWRESPDKPVLMIRSWRNEPSSEFISDYIRPLGLKYSLSFVLYDLNGMPRTVLILDKTSGESFSDQELMTLNLVVPQLNNLHKNFFCQQTNRQNISKISWETTTLTAREIEIANLLCRGVSPSNISKSLHIAKSTTYKHIAHIYEKMHVSTRQELLVRLMG